VPLSGIHANSTSPLFSSQHLTSESSKWNFMQLLFYIFFIFTTVLAFGRQEEVAARSAVIIPPNYSNQQQLQFYGTKCRKKLCFCSPTFYSSLLSAHLISFVTLHFIEFYDFLFACLCKSHCKTGQKPIRGANEYKPVRKSRRQPTKRYTI